MIVVLLAALTVTHGAALVIGMYLGRTAEARDAVDRLKPRSYEDQDHGGID